MYRVINFKSRIAWEIKYHYCENDERIKKIGLNGDIWTGIDVNTGEKIDLRETGIIDPTKVTRAALENAASVAGTILLTECVVTHDPTYFDSIKHKMEQNQQQTQQMMM